MKVVLKETVLDRILKKFAEAARDGREVDYVAVTPDENRELLMDRRIDRHMDLSRWVRYDPESSVEATYQTRNFEFTATSPEARRACQGRYLTVASFDKFRGVSLFVVPPEYMPR